jgi:hypothetical protein
MNRFLLTEDFDADCVVSDRARAGEIYRVQGNRSGGAVLTPVARYFAWRPEFIEGFHAFWRVDCFIREHPLAPQPAESQGLGKALVEALFREGLCNEPLWLSVHRSHELNGTEYGEVFDYD